VRPVETVSVPTAAPTTVGVKVTEIVQLVAGTVQFVAVIAKPGPSTVGLRATRAPLLVTVTIFAGLA
jgi:hypothetical protein